MMCKKKIFRLPVLLILVLLATTGFAQKRTILVTPGGKVFAGSGGTFILAGPVINDTPLASSVTISGTTEMGQILTANYSYSDAQSDQQGTSTYQWYRADDASGSNQAAIAGATASTYILAPYDWNKYITVGVTPVAVSGPSPGAEALAGYVGPVTLFTPPAPLIGSFSGKRSFDIAMSNDNINNCGAVSVRVSRQADFTSAATNTQSYTFTPTGTVSNVRFGYDNTNGAPITAISGGNPGVNITGDVVATVTYSQTLNTDALGLTNTNALTARIYVVCNNSSDGTGTDQSLELTVSIKDCASCGAMVSPTVYKEFMCHNLGADQSLDPDVPVEGIHGNYYQWGKKDAYANTSAIYGAWSRTPAADGTWSDDSKTSRDPCPAGYRVPTENQWYGVANYNTAFRTGSWADDGNFTTALHFGPDAGTKTLTLPATGFRDHIDAAVWNRGAEGYYWSSTVSYTDAWAYRCQSSIASSGATTSRASGSSVRCISE